MGYVRKQLCSHSGCKEYAVAGSVYCEKHQRPPRITVEDNRSKFRFMYNAAWKKASRAWLMLPEHHWCEMCLQRGKYTPADTVHHKIEHEGNWELFWDRSNWQALCKSCHSRHHMQELNKRGK